MRWTDDADAPAVPIRTWSKAPRTRTRALIASGHPAAAGAADFRSTVVDYAILADNGPSPALQRLPRRRKTARRNRTADIRWRFAESCTSRTRHGGSRSRTRTATGQPPYLPLDRSSAPSGGGLPISPPDSPLRLPILLTISPWRRIVDPDTPRPLCWSYSHGEAKVMSGRR